MRTVIANKYVIDEGGGCSGVSNESHGVSLWKFIRGSWGRFSQNTRFVVGRGLRICFWDDLWCGELPLKGAFPLLYCIARDRNAYVAEHLFWHNGIAH